MLLAVPLALFVYLSAQSRYFGRWLLPAYPVLAMLAAVGLVQAASLVRSARWRTAALAGATALVLVQPLAADIRSAQVLGRDDTRQQARDWIERTYPPELRASVEPAVPGAGSARTPMARCRRGCRAARAAPAGPRPAGPTRARAGARSASQYKPGLVARPDGGVRASAYHLVL